MIYQILSLCMKNKIIKTVFLLKDGILGRLQNHSATSSANEHIALL